MFSILSIEYLIDAGEPQKLQDLSIPEICNDLFPESGKGWRQIMERTK